MKIKLFLAAKNQGDGSINISIHSSKDHALKELDRTEQQIEEGSPYDDGSIEEVELEFNTFGLLNKEPVINFDGI